MPAPLGQQARTHKFLLRMTADEDAYARDRARRLGTSLNDAITGALRDAMEAERRTAPDPAPVRPEPDRPAPAPLPPRRKQRRPLRSTQDRASDLIGPPPEPIPGQTSITDPDQ